MPKPADFWKHYVRPDLDGQRRQKRAWGRALSALRRHHIEEFEGYYRRELEKEERLRQIEQWAKEQQSQPGPESGSA